MRKVRSTLSALFAISAVFPSGIYAAGKVDELYQEKIAKFTPPDVKVVTPTDTVPKECAMFTGEWGPGLVSYVNMAIKIIVENVAPDCSAQVVAVWAMRQEFPNDPGAGGKRYNVKIVQSSFELKDVANPGATWVLKMNGTGTSLGGVSTNLRGRAYFELPR